MTFQKELGCLLTDGGCMPMGSTGKIPRSLILADFSEMEKFTNQTHLFPLELVSNISEIVLA